MNEEVETHTYQFLDQHGIPYEKLSHPADKPFKTKYLSSQLGHARLSFATEEHMVSLLGIHPGAVSPMGLMNDEHHQVLLVIDQDLLSQEYIGCPPLRQHRPAPPSPPRLAGAIRACHGA
jgi:hypothetical protein